VSPDSMTSGWYYAKAGAPAGREIGPLSWEDLYLLASEGRLDPADVVWNPRLPRGVTAGLIPGLFPALVAPQPGPPVTTTVVPPLPIQPPASKPVEPMWDVTQTAVQAPEGATPSGAQTEPEAQDFSTERLGEDDAEAASPKESDPPKAGRQSHSLPWLIVLLVLVVAAAGVAAYFLYFRDSGGGVQSDTTVSSAIEVSGLTTTTTSSAVPAVWTRLVTSGATPAARSYHAMAYDPSTDRTILFGGSSMSAKYDDTWALDLTSNTWTKLATPGTAPSARDNSQMVYDSVGGGIILFGGSDATGDRNDLWVFDARSNAWTALKPSGTLPQARGGHAMVYDPNTNRVLVFGGLNSGTSELLNDLWAYDLTTNAWTRLNPSGTPPSKRQYPAIAYCAATRRVLLFGGLTLSDNADAGLGDLWAYDPIGNAWERITPTGTTPSARQGQAMAYAPALGGLFMFGGLFGTMDLDESWMFNPTADEWTRMQPVGDGPGARDGLAMAYDSAAGAAVLFGGYNSTADLDLGDAWVYGPTQGDSVP
jgi:hypothetical protein